MEQIRQHYRHEIEVIREWRRSLNLKRHKHRENLMVQSILKRAADLAGKEIAEREKQLQRQPRKATTRTEKRTTNKG